MALLFDPDAWLTLAMLTLMEIVLGIDNIVFISIITTRLPLHQQRLARLTGLILALAGRLGLLLLISWLMHLTRPWGALMGREFSGRDVILIGGGLFLIVKATREIHGRTEHENSAPAAGRPAVNLAWVIAQILLLDLVFSLDSVITAVGMANDFRVMATAIVLAIICMLVFARRVSDFIHRHPSTKVLALAFLLLIGVMLVADGMGQHIPKGYIYFAMAFSLAVEMINLRQRTRMPSGTAAPQLPPVA